MTIMEEKQVIEGVVESPKKVAKGKKGIDTPKGEVKTVSSTEQPKPKRFENHTLSFMYFLKMINYELLWDKQVPRDNILSKHRNSPYRSQRRWLLEIAHYTLSRARWYKGVENNWQIAKVDTDNIESCFRTNFEDNEYQEVISWELIDFHARQIANKESFLPRNKRDFIMEVFSWVDNFVAKEGEEITMGIDDINNIKSTEDILKKAQETIS